MTSFSLSSSVVLALAILTGCADLKPANTTQFAADSFGACAGGIIQPPEGLIETNDNKLLQDAKDNPGNGKLCQGKVFEAKKPVTVYRVWDSSNSYTAYGKWWSLSYPTGNRDSYRQAEDICPEWSALDRLIKCTIKVGAKVVIGPGQSVDCANGVSYPPSAENQVYIPNDSKNNQLYVDCREETVDWPRQAN